MIIGIVGFAQVGKDTLAEQLPNYERFAFADKLKDEVYLMLASVDIKPDFNNAEDKKQWRDLLVFWGRKRRQLDSNYWVKAVCKSNKFVTLCGINENVILTDVRYINEVERILEFGGKVIRLRRPCYSPANEEEAMTIQIIDNKYPDLPVLVNDGSTEQLKNNFLGIMEVME